jgi:ketosteroid isomerase-like protein
MMKPGLLFTLAALAIGLATPALAQLQDTVDPEVRQEIEAVTKRREEAFNKHDAAACSAFYTEFAIDVPKLRAEGAAVGLPAIKKNYETLFASHARPISFKVLQVYAIANKICAIVDYTDRDHLKGQNLVIYVYVPDAEDWKVRLSYPLMP